MKFKLLSRNPSKANMNENTIYLKKDNWDDFGYKTLFHAWILHKNELFEIGLVSLTNIDYDLNNGTKLNQIDEDMLNKPNQRKYISLGSLEYYNELIMLGDKKRISVLKQLNDIAYNLKTFDKYKELDVVQTSFLRGIKTYDVRTRYHRLANGINSITYDINIEKKSSPNFNLFLHVNTDSLLPSNIHALIGTNGSGKTFTLTEIADACSGYIEDPEDLISSESKNHNFVAKIKSSTDDVLVTRWPLEGIIYMSYSPFDSYKDIINNQYISFIGLKGRTSQSGTLKKTSINKQLQYLLNQDIKDTHGKIKVNTIPGNKEKISLWNDVIRGLSFDINFRNLSEELFLDPQDVETNISLRTIKKLSSGQKMILLSFANIINDAVEKTFIIIDEPELFLHPPLITAYVRELSKILNKTNSLCLIATHSPFIIQELPSECVHILTRKGKELAVHHPNTQTFGESIASINNTIFGTDMRLTGFFKYLNELAENSPEKATELLETQKLGIEAELVLRAALMDGGEQYWSE